MNEFDYMCRAYGLIPRTACDSTALFDCCSYGSAGVPKAPDHAEETLKQVLGDTKNLVKNKILTPKRILRSGPATIVFWADGTKTIVKRSPDEEDNEYAAFTAALAIKIFGSNSKVKKVVKTKTEEQK